MARPKFGVIYSRLHPVIAPDAFGREVEAMGYDSVWATDGPVNELPALDPIVAIAGLALGTTRIAVGSCVILSPLRNPVILAKEAASLDVLSGGRLVLGIGVGGSSLSSPHAFRAVGVAVGERGARCDEGIEIMTKLWSGEHVSHAGRFHRFEDVRMTPVPLQRPHPPIWAGGDAEGVLRRVARACDGFVPIGSGAESYRAHAERIATLARGHGREPAAITRAVHLYFCLARDRGEGRAIAERVLSERYGYPVRLAEDDRFALGSAEDCLETITAYRAAGVEHFIINTVRPLEDVVGEVRHFAERVLPRVH
ncbi:MAG: LLM class flavin-dependent oxidoreductase [Alphaproteobacteria bacterium]